MSTITRRRSDTSSKLDALGTPCRLCPRQCGVRRDLGERGYCGAGDRVRVYRYAPHHGEEPPLSGTRGSGTVFFSHCTMRCLYCQNFPCSQEHNGRDYTVSELARIFIKLYEAGCHNWNLVSPTPWLREIDAALQLARAAGADLPIVYNTSGFERLETIRALTGKVAIYLSDLRYALETTALEASDTPAYVAAARSAALEMHRQVGPFRVDHHGIAIAGLICRVLVLPGHADEACANLEWLAHHIGVEAPISLMSQYTPAYRATALPNWERYVTREEYEMARRCLERLGFKNGWIQEYNLQCPDELLGYKMMTN